MWDVNELVEHISSSTIHVYIFFVFVICVGEVGDIFDQKVKNGTNTNVQICCEEAEKVFFIICK